MANDKRDILRKAAIAKFEADEGLKPNGDDVIARADRMSMIAFGRGFDAGHAAATAEGILQADGWVAIDRDAENLPKKVDRYLFRDVLGNAKTEVFDLRDFNMLNDIAKGFFLSLYVAWMPIPPYQRQSSEGDVK